MHERFRIPMPEAGEKAYVAFDIPTMKELHDYYGEDYLTRVSVALDRRNIVALRKCLELMLKDANVTGDDLIEKFTLADLSERLTDAISLCVYGKRVAELEPAA